MIILSFVLVAWVNCKCRFKITYTFILVSCLYLVPRAKSYIASVKIDSFQVLAGLLSWRFFIQECFVLPAEPWMLGTVVTGEYSLLGFAVFFRGSSAKTKHSLHEISPATRTT